MTHVSSSNFPNAGHSVVFEDGWKFVAKAIPTAAALKKAGQPEQAKELAKRVFAAGSYAEALAIMCEFCDVR